MAWYLNLPNNVVYHASLPTPLAVNYGTDAYTIEFEILIPAGTTKAVTVIGQITNSALNGIYFNSSGRFSIAVAGSNILFSNTSCGLFDGNWHKYRFEHDAGGAWRIYRDNALFQSGSYSGAATANPALNALFRQSTSTATANFPAWQVKYVEVTGFGAGSAKWDANLSGGAGSTLPSVGGVNDATLVGLTVPDCWVFYSSGATYQLTAQGGTFTYSGQTAALNRGFKLAAQGGTYSYTGASANLSYTTATVYRLDALGASYSYAGASASLLRGFKLTANGGAYSYAGADASLVYVAGPTVYRLTALGVTYVYSGANATLTATGVIPAANPAAFVNRAYVGGRLTNSAKIGGSLTNNATVAI